MAWGTGKPTGYYKCWKEGLKGLVRIKAKNEMEARQKCKAQHGFSPDSCTQELD